MWKKLFTFGLILSLAPNTMANPNHVTQQSFDFSKTDVNYFYCDVLSDKVSEVQMENHNVLITGFDKNGKFSLNGNEVKKLTQFYFTAKADPKKNGHRNVVIYYNGDNQGDVKCYGGKGNRGADIGGGFGR